VTDGEPQWEGPDREFEVAGEAWIARPAGSGVYGTGDLGTAWILAVHFYRSQSKEPVREALVPAATFPHMGDADLAELLAQATPIEVDKK
jgi:hypothetical protein